MPFTHIPYGQKVPWHVLKKWRPRIFVNSKFRTGVAYNGQLWTTADFVPYVLSAVVWSRLMSYFWDHCLLGPMSFFFTAVPCFSAYATIYLCLYCKITLIKDDKDRFSQLLACGWVFKWSVNFDMSQENISPASSPHNSLKQRYPLPRYCACDKA